MDKLIWKLSGLAIVAILLIGINYAPNFEIAIKPSAFKATSLVEIPAPVFPSNKTSTTIGKNSIKELSLEQKIEKIFPNLEIQNSASEDYYLLLFSVIKKFPLQKINHIRDIIIKNDPRGQHRGLAGAKTIILNTNQLSAAEFVAVAVHEFCHGVDLGGINGDFSFSQSNFSDGDLPVYKNDPSLKFYQLSWVNNQSKQEFSQDTNFVSGYAMKDPFEDLAESCSYYVLHNKEFISLANHNQILQAKYNWIKEYFFQGYVFPTGHNFIETNRRSWDITLLPFDLTKFYQIKPNFNHIIGIAL
jgi:hypothetical protein